MKIAFTGHRDKIANPADLDGIPTSALWVHGGAVGFDSQVEQYAKEHGIRTQVIKPDYSRWGMSAPLVRNRQIVNGADYLYACYDGREHGGTIFTIRLARQLGIPVHIIGCIDKPKSS